MARKDYNPLLSPAQSVKPFSVAKRITRSRRAPFEALLAALAVFLALPGGAQLPPVVKSVPNAFEARVQGLLSSPAAEKAHWGVLVADAASGEALYSLNAGQFFTPASTTKLFTTALALAKLGPDFRFRTTLESTSWPDGRGRLRGDLFLVGRGSPALTNRRYPYDPHTDRDGQPEKALAQMVNDLVANGVQRIDGDIVVDESAFEDQPYPAGWDIDDLKYDFGAPVTALVVNDNVFFAEVTPDERVGSKAHMILQPPLADRFVTSTITTSEHHQEAQLHIVWQPGSPTIEVTGSVPLGGKAQHFSVANPSPAAYAADLLKFLLVQRDVKISGSAKVLEYSADVSAAPSENPRHVLVENLSPPLNEIVTMTNKNSQNLYAELLLRAVALSANGLGSLGGGLLIEKNYFQQANVPADDFFLADGSGLSEANLATPTAMVSLLRYAATQPWGVKYRSSLPVAGADGTLAMQMKDTPATGKIQAKTGTLEHAKAMGGYATTLSGRNVVFAIFVSQSSMTAHEATVLVDGICTAMIEEIPAAPAATCAQCPK